MKKIKLLIRTIAMVFQKEKLQGIELNTSNHPNDKDHFFVYSLGNISNNIYFLISKTVNKKHEVHKIELTSKEAIDIGIINENNLIVYCKAQILKQQLANDKT